MHRAQVSRVTVHLLAALLAAFALQGCAKVNHLRDAQSAFGETAALENRLTLNLVNEGEGSVSRAELETQVRAGYGSVLASLQSAEEDQGAFLKQNRLYGNFLMLRAMTFWRLGDTANATATAAAAEQLPDDQLFPRDRAMALAMPGLIRNSQAHAIVSQKMTQPFGMPRDQFDAVKAKVYKDAVGLLSSAEEAYDKALKSVASKHALVVYLNEAKLAGYKNWIDAFDKLRGGSRLPGKLHDKMRLTLEALKRGMCNAGNVAVGNPLDSGDSVRLTSWSLTLGLATLPPGC